MPTITLTLTDSKGSAADLSNAIFRKDAFAGMQAIRNFITAVQSGNRLGRIRVQSGSIDRTFSNGPTGGNSATVTITVSETANQIAARLTAPAADGQRGMTEVLNLLSEYDCGTTNATIAVSSGSSSATYDEGRGAGVTLADVNGGPTLWYKASGITNTSGKVSSWASEGSNTLAIANATAGERPTLQTIGSLSVPQFDGSDDYLLAGSNFTLVEKYTVAALLRVDTFTDNRRIFDSGNTNGGFLTFHTASGNKLRYEQGSTDLISGTALVNAKWYSIIAVIAGDGGTSTIYLNNSSDGTVAGTSQAPTASALAIGAIASSGNNNGAFTLADFAVWNSVDNPSVADMFAYHEYIAGQLSVTLG